jgi:hypothetical protein
MSLPSLLDFIQLTLSSSRKVPPTEFGFNFAFGKKRQENAQVPTPARSLRSNTKTPQSQPLRPATRQPSPTSARRNWVSTATDSSAQKSQRSSSRQPSTTPTRLNRELNVIPSIVEDQNQSAPVNDAHRATVPDSFVALSIAQGQTPVIEGGRASPKEKSFTETSNRPAKRRRITSGAATPDPNPSTASQRRTPSTRASRRRTASKAFSIAEDDSLGHAQENRPISSHFVADEESQKENLTPGHHQSKSPTPTSDFQTTKSGRILLHPQVDQDETSHGAAALEDVEEDEATVGFSAADETATGLAELATTKRTGEGAPEDNLPKQHVSLEPESEPEAGGDNLEANTLDLPRTALTDVERATTPPGARRRNQRQPAPQKRGRHASVQVESKDAPVKSTTVLPSTKATAVKPTKPKSALVDRISRYSKLAAAKLQNPSRPSSEREQTPQDRDEDDNSYIESSPEPETPAVPKPVRRRDRWEVTQSQSADAPMIRQAKRGGKEKFPILIHRLGQISRLDTIEEEEDVNPPADSVKEKNLADRKQPNGVDVLAQICRETISTMLDRIPETGKAGERATARNKRSALQAFGSTLDDELFAMSEAVENRINLEARVRKSKRENAALQSEYLELRREREQIALKCDAVRREHWDYEEETRQKWTLSEAARRVEQDLGRDDTQGEEGLEFLLRTTTSLVSSSSDSGGTLYKVKAFNLQLERMAMLLDKQVD